MNNTSEYNQDTWNDLNKYIKRKAKSKLDDKINNIRKRKEKEVRGMNN